LILSTRFLFTTVASLLFTLIAVGLLAKHNPKKLYLAARSKSKYDIALAEIQKAVPDAKVTFLQLDLASFTSIKSAADIVLSTTDRLDILMNNAGVMALPPGLTSEGYEIQFGTNHLGHALLTKLLTPLLLKTSESPNSDVRIINLTSAAEMMAPKGGFIPETVTTDMETYHTYTRYGQSKLANVLFTRELAKRYPGIKSVAIHPGRVRTALLDTMFGQGMSPLSIFQNTYDFFVMMPVEKGALNQLWAATGPKAVVKTATYYAPVGKEGGESKLSHDMSLAAKLWEWQEAQFAKHGF